MVDGSEVQPMTVCVFNCLDDYQHLHSLKKELQCLLSQFLS